MLLQSSESCLRSYDVYGDIGSEMERVYSRLPLSTPRDCPLLEWPREKPLLAETCLVLGLVDIVMVSGVRPRRVLIFTTPDDISPYSTLGTPVMTSTDSIFDDAMLLVLMPLNEPLLEFVKEALLLSLTPSTSTAVVKELLPPSALPPRMLNCFSVVRVGSLVAPPGSRLLMSETFITCTWSSAVLSMVRAVVALLASS